MSRRNTLLLLLGVVLSVLLQSSFLPQFFDTPFKPDLLLVIVVFLALRGSFESGLPLSWLLGLLNDCLCGLYLGLNAFSFLVIYLVIKSVSERLYAESSLLFVLIVSIATVACTAGNLLLLLMFTSTSDMGYSMVADMIPHMLTNAFAASLATLLPAFDTAGDAA